MEKIEQSRSIIHRLLEEYREFYQRNTRTDVDTEIVADDIHGQYMVMRVGWRGETRVRRPLFYLRLKENKIWIEEDWTKDGIVSELMAEGVCRDEIVLAFQTPNLPSFKHGQSDYTQNRHEWLPEGSVREVLAELEKNAELQAKA